MLKHSFRYNDRVRIKNEDSFYYGSVGKVERCKTMRRDDSTKLDYVYSVVIGHLLVECWPEELEKY